MYESYFGYTTKPFAINPDPQFLYRSEQHESALTMLEYAVESQAPFCVLTGEIGSGKTTLLRYLMRCLGNRVTVGMISNAHARFGSIHPWARAAFGVPARGESDVAHYEALVDFFVKEYGAGRRCLLVVDEAQNLTTLVLEELRLLSNINSEKDLAVQTLLVGQPQLRDRLRQPELEQFAQRVTVDFHLGALTHLDTAAYIRHRITVADGDPLVFGPEVVMFIHTRTGGVPRLINQLCDLALLYAFADRKTEVTVPLLQQVLMDRKAKGAIPLFRGIPLAQSPTLSVARPDLG